MPAMIELLQQSPPVAIAAASLLGLLIGSFLNVVIYRVPVMLEREWAAQAAELAGVTADADAAAPASPDGAKFNLMVPRSRCPSCGHEEPHRQGEPCTRRRCPQCGQALIRR